MFFRRKEVVLFGFMILLLAAGYAGERQERRYCIADIDEMYEKIRQKGAIYEVEERVVTFQNEGMNLVCTLVLPKGLRKPPIAITLNGFGEDRYYKIIPETGEEWYYERLSRILAEQGIATLRIDFRGSGDSDGDFSMTTFSTQVSDALAAIKYVSRNLRRVVDFKNIGLVGFSQGGIVASVAAAADDRVDSVALWSAVASPPITYEYLLTRDGIQQGIDLPDGGVVTIDVYIEGQFYGSITLGKAFFQDLTTIQPVAAIRDYEGPLLYVAGLQDKIVWPQPYMARMYMDYHDGFEKIFTVNTDHEFATHINAVEFDKVLYYTAAWFIVTLD